MLSPRPPSSPAAPLLEMRGVVKSFPGAKALRGVDLTLRAGEVLALLGENGAGKSTLIKVLAGAHFPDEGRIRIEGREADIRSPADAQRLGVSVIYQEFNLIPGLTVTENVFLGQELSRFGFVRRREQTRRVEKLFADMGVSLPADEMCGRLSVAQQQITEIAKALSARSKIIVMDEPSAALTQREVDKLFAIARDLKRRGLGVIYISHRLDEIFAVADRVTVLRDGRNIADRDTRAVARRELIELMVGRTIDQEFPPRSAPIGPPRLVARGLNRGARVRDVSFEIRRGEVLGLTGLVGAGRTETARLIFGADPCDSGAIELDGRPLHPRSPRDAIAAGIGLLTEDRKAQGLVLGLPVRDNFSLPNFSTLARFGFVRGARESERVAAYVRDLSIRVSGADQPARNLSGGNQQKLVLAKWLERNCEVLLFDEPTRGVDVGAKFEVYQLINRLAAQGKAILLITSELPEALGMCDRILVMRDGRVAGEVSTAEGAAQEQILRLAVGE